MHEKFISFIDLFCLCFQDLREGKIDMSKYRDEKGRVAADQQNFTQTKLKEHKDYLETEIRKFRRQQIEHRHNLETKLLREVCKIGRYEAICHHPWKTQ